MEGRILVAIISIISILLSVRYHLVVMSTYYIRCLAGKHSGGAINSQCSFFFYSRNLGHTIIYLYTQCVPKVILYVWSSASLGYILLQTMMYLSKEEQFQILTGICVLRKNGGHMEQVLYIIAFFFSCFFKSRMPDLLDTLYSRKRRRRRMSIYYIIMYTLSFEIAFNFYFITFLIFLWHCLLYFCERQRKADDIWN